MSNILIKQGAHYHRFPPLTTLPWAGSPSMARHVTFDANCEYDTTAYNADDVNKLFGLSFGLRGVHHNSARFGWRWSKSKQCIELLAYSYINGQRNWDEQLRFPVVAEVKLGERVKCEIEYDEEGAYIFAVHTEGGGFMGCEQVRCPTKPAHYGLTCGPYFGGLLTAPHDMTLTLSRS